MGSDEHKRGDRKHKFCTQPAQPKCGDVSGCADYIKVCKPGWAGHTFERLVKAAGGAFTFQKKYEAHHLVCVAPATDQLLGNPAIQGAIEQTEWCINNEGNMVAMPLWGHTVKWYCSVTAVTAGALGAQTLPPPWVNWPQHDVDHNSKEGYTWEVEQKLQKVAAKVEKVDHKLSGNALQGALKKLSGDFKSELIRRGIRKGGTHVAWSLAQPPTSDPHWYEPFSMASDGKFTELGFPVRSFDEKVKKWIKRIQQGIAGLKP